MYRYGSNREVLLICRMGCHYTLTGLGARVRCEIRVGRSRFGYWRSSLTFSRFSVSAASPIKRDLPANSAPHTTTPWSTRSTTLRTRATFSKRRSSTTRWAAEADCRMARRTASACRSAATPWQAIAAVSANQRSSTRCAHATNVAIVIGVRVLGYDLRIRRGPRVGAQPFR